MVKRYDLNDDTVVIILAAIEIEVLVILVILCQSQNIPDFIEIIYHVFRLNLFVCVYLISI